jgi:hypothetical protein
MATLPTTPTAATVGSKVTATNWNNQVQLPEEFFRLNRPVFLGYQTVTQSLTTATTTVITLDTELIDRDNQHSTTTNTDRVVIGGTLGWYRVTGQVAYAGNATGDRRAQILKNGASAGTGYSIIPASTTNLITVQITTIVQATANTDYVSLAGYQSSGGALSTLNSGGCNSYLLVEWIGS